jgi:putative (di)nucleoside polyphosphate hydrolase
MLLPMPTRFFRAGVGTVIYNADFKVAIFERTKPPIGEWEFQQGGIDVGEAPRETLWRELEEEIGLFQTDFDLVTEHPHWLLYENREVVAGELHDRIGQAHKWFFLKLKPDVNIDISKALQDEVSDFKWTTFEEVVKLPGPHKIHVYEDLHRYFKTKIRI